MTNAILRKAGIVATALLLLVGTLIAWPEPPVRPLVPAEGWEVQGGFVAMQPDTHEIHESILKNPQARFWRSWSPDAGSQPGILRSRPFRSNGRIVVPYNGFAGERGIGTYLECVEDGRRLHLATSRNNTQWSEVHVTPPADFCAGEVRVVAESTSTDNYVALGTPFEVSPLTAFKQSTLPALWFLFIAWMTIAGWFLAIASWTSVRLPHIDPMASGLIGIGLIGYLQFFAFWLLPALGSLLSLLLVICAGAWLTRRFLRRSSIASASAPGMESAAAVWLLVAMALLALVLAADSGAGAWEVNGRFTPARWSSDNQLPGLIAQMLVSGIEGNPSNMGPWTVADRPPMAYGWHATLHALFRGITAGNDGEHVFYLYQLAIGIVLNTSWVALLFVLTGRLGLARPRSLLVVAIATLCPFFIFNSTFVWPKLLSGTFAFMAAWILLGMDRDSPPLRRDDRGLVAAAVLSALGLLSHGGSVFGIIATIGLAVVYRGMPSVKGAVMAGTAAIAILLPWSLWQSNVMPPGNALVKYAFAGTFGFGEEHIGVVDTVIRSYSNLTLDDWVASKRDGLASLLFGVRNTCGIHEIGASYSLVDRWRASNFYSIAPSMTFLLLGLIAFTALRQRRAADHIMQASSKLLLLALTSLVTGLLIMWDCHIIHVQSYQGLIAAHMALILALFTAGKWGRAALALNVAYGLVVWVFEPLKHFARFDYVAAAALIACVVAYVFALRASLLDERCN